MKKTNPFSLSFGKKPFEYISRFSQTERIINDFSSTPSPSHVCNLLTIWIVMAASAAAAIAAAGIVITRRKSND